MAKDEKVAKATVEDSTSDTEEAEAPKEKSQQPASGSENSENSVDGSPEPGEEKVEQGGSKKSAGKQVTTEASSTPWQAIWSPQYNAYYFYNPETQQTTWENPLEPSSAASSATPAPTTDSGTEESNAEESAAGPADYASKSSALHNAALAAGIDPALAHLDPTLVASIGGPGVASGSGLPSFTAKFNARTGQFTRPDGRDPSHLSEHARAQRMSEFYFDVNAWENQLAEQGGSIQGSDDSRKRKRPTKKDLERFKEQKKAKKMAKTAWLRT